MTTYVFTFKSPKNKHYTKMRLGLARMVSDIQNQAVRNAPYKNGGLVNSARFKATGFLQYTVTFGGGKVPYARRREFENNLHPSKKFYLRRAGRSVSRRYKSYFKGL